MSLSVNKPRIGPQPQTDQESVKKVFNKMKKDKASGASCVVSENLLASGYLGIERMNQIIAENKVPEDWNTSVILRTALKIKLRQLNK